MEVVAAMWAQWHTHLLAVVPQHSCSWRSVEPLQGRRVPWWLTASDELNSFLFSDHILESFSSVLCQGEAQYTLVSRLLFAVYRSLTILFSGLYSVGFALPPGVQARLRALQKMPLLVWIERCSLYHQWRSHKWQHCKVCSSRVPPSYEQNQINRTPKRVWTEQMSEWCIILTLFCV